MRIDFAELSNLMWLESESDWYRIGFGYGSNDPEMAWLRLMFANGATCYPHGDFDWDWDEIEDEPTAIEKAVWHSQFDSRIDPLLKGQQVRMRAVYSGVFHDREFLLLADVPISRQVYETHLRAIEILPPDTEDFHDSTKSPEYQDACLTKELQRRQWNTIQFFFPFSSMMDVEMRGKKVAEQMNIDKSDSKLPQQGEAPAVFWNRISNLPGQPPKGRFSWDGD